MHRFPLREGELVLLIGPNNKRHLLRLQAGNLFHHPKTGHLAPNDIVGKPPGRRFLTEKGIPVICLRLTLEGSILKKTPPPNPNHLPTRLCADPDSRGHLPWSTSS